jgi:SsrA-binding protein
MDNNVNIKNKRASHDYEFIDKYIAGIQLTGTEIKSIRNGKAGLVDSFCFFVNNELFIKNMHVAEYWWGNMNNHDPRRDRKLLLTRKELEKLRKRSQEKGLTIVAYRLFISEKGLAKVEIALAKGKKEYDKREDLKQKDARREMDRAMKI